MSFFNKSVLFLFFIIKLSINVIRCDENERRLYDRLLENYNVMERPIENSSYDPIPVYLRIFLIQIIDVKWHDYRLQWDPDRNNNVTSLIFPYGKLWKPDVLLYNSAGSSFDTAYPSNFLVYNNGEVNWIPPATIKSSCNIATAWFPFDEQICYLKFGSWTYNGWKMDLRILGEGFDTSEYVESGEWQLINTPVKPTIKFYKCCPEPYPDIKFYLHIRRRTLFFGINLIIPSLLISLMCLLGFALPVESGEKITLEITIHNSVCVLLSVVAQISPPTSESLPLIGTFFTYNMLVVSLSVVFNVVVLNFHYRTPVTHTMSPLMRKILLNWLPWILMIKRPGQHLSKHTLLESCKKKKKTIKNQRKQPPDILITSIENDYVDLSTYENKGFSCQEPPPPTTTDTSDIESRIKASIKNLEISTTVDYGIKAVMLSLLQIYNELNFIDERMKRDESLQKAKNEWKFAAIVIDRLCLYIFTTIVICCSCGIFFSPAHVIV